MADTTPCARRTQLARCAVLALALALGACTVVTDQHSCVFVHLKQPLPTADQIAACEGK